MEAVAQKETRSHMRDVASRIGVPRAAPPVRAIARGRFDVARHSAIGGGAVRREGGHGVLLRRVRDANARASAVHPTTIPKLDQ